MVLGELMNGPSIIMEDSELMNGPCSVRVPFAIVCFPTTFYVLYVQNVFCKILVCDE